MGLKTANIDHLQSQSRTESADSELPQAEPVGSQHQQILKEQHQLNKDICFLTLVSRGKNVQDANKKIL